jgi:hypothetical protein
VLHLSVNVLNVSHALLGVLFPVFLDPIPYPTGNIRQAAYILVSKPSTIRYAFIFGAQRGRTSVKILTVHKSILCPQPGLTATEGGFSIKVLQTPG